MGMACLMDGAGGDVSGIAAAATSGTTLDVQLCQISAVGFVRLGSG